MCLIMRGAYVANSVANTSRVSRISKIVQQNNRYSHAVLAVFALALLLQFSNATLACEVDTSGINWCNSPVTYSFVGPDWNNILNGGLVMKSAVYSTISAINSATQTSGTDIYLTEVGNGGQLTLIFGSTPAGKAAQYVGSPPSGCALPSCTIYGSGVITFNSSIFLTLNPVFNRETVALHELLHALGLGHTKPGTNCPTSHVMYESINPGDIKTNIDGSIISALECIYGNSLISTCGTILRYLVKWVAQIGGGAPIWKGFCDGCGCGTPISTYSTTASSTLTYELAISESGGPFVIIATLTDADWINNEYFFTPQNDLTAAILRMRVFDGALVVGETQTWQPIDIVGVNLLGDVNLDGHVNVGDYIKLIQYVLGLGKLPPIAAINAGDLNGNNQLDAGDIIVYPGTFLGL